MLFFWNCVGRFRTNSALRSGDVGVVDDATPVSKHFGSIDRSTDSFGFVRRGVPSVLNFPSILKLEINYCV